MATKRQHSTAQDDLVLADPQVHPHHQIPDFLGDHKAPHPQKGDVRAVLWDAYPG